MNQILGCLITLKYYSIPLQCKNLYSSSEPSPFAVVLSTSYSSSSSSVLSSDSAAGASCNSGGKEVGSIVLNSKSALTSLVYFSDLSALVRVTTADIFRRMLSVKVVASCVVPSVLFKINPFGNDESLISEPVWRS